MITVTRQRQIPVVRDQVFALLSDPENLPKLMDRVQRLEIDRPLERGWAVTVTFNFGSQLGQRTAPGTWTFDATSISFRSREPLPILARWTLQEQPAATHIIALLEFNLKPLLGPLAVMAPTTLIKRRVSGELEKALERVETVLVSSNA